MDETKTAGPRMVGVGQMWAMAMGGTVLTVSWSLLAMMGDDTTDGMVYVIALIIWLCGMGLILRTAYDLARYKGRRHKLWIGLAIFFGLVSLVLPVGWLPLFVLALLPNLRVDAAAAPAVRADPVGPAPGYTRGELEIITSGGTAAMPVRLGVHVRRSWRLLALAVAAGIAVAAAPALLLAGIKIPAAGPTAAPPLAHASHHGVHGRQVSASRPSFNQQTAWADIRSAIGESNIAWQTALMYPSTSDLASFKTGRDLARDVADVGSLLAAGEHWQIGLQRFKVLSVHVSDDDRSGWGIVEKTERRALYGPGHTRAPYEISDATYRLRYHLVHEAGRWLVDDVAVQSVTPFVAPGPPLTVQQAVAGVLPAVIHVEADSSGPTAVGTGFVIQSSATASYIITNDHVVNGASTVKLQRWSTVQDAYVPTVPWIAAQVWEDPADDLAVVKIAQGNLPVAAWGNSDALQVADAVAAIGYAENLSGGPGVTNGIVSNVLRTAPDNPNGPTYIGHSAPINPGNSGGPLVDMSGHVVGINTWTLDNTQGLFFAIPSSRAARVAAGFIGSNG